MGFRWAVAGIAGAVLVGCTPIRLLNDVVLAHPYHRIRNVAYGPHKRQDLDIYVPKRPARRPATVVVFFYGGYWRYGAKHEYQFVGEALTSRGVIAVVPNYRLYPTVHWRGLLADGARAYRWVRHNIRNYGGNPRRIFVMGHSAGGYIAAMLAFDHTLLRTAGVRSSPCGFIGLAGPYSFLPMKDPKVRAVFSTARDLAATQPIHYVRPGDPPALLLVGQDDHTVNPRNSYRLARALRADGDSAQLISYPGIGHIRLLVSLASPFRFLAPSLRDTMRFIQSTSCGG